MKVIFCSLFRSKRWVMLVHLIILCAGIARAEKWIRVNQMGYLPDQSKVAVLMSREKCDVKTFSIVDYYTGKPILTLNNVKPFGRYGQMASTYRFNFSALKRPGSYFIQSGDARSEVFPVGNRVYDGSADFVLNYMRQQRCGWNPYYRDSCHTKDGYIVNHPTKAGQHIDVRGGWHDAADCLQYTTTSANAIYQMMFAYQQNPGAFEDCHKADGTAGKNGIPDIVDEIYWGLQWLDKMNPTPGEYYNQIADDRDHAGMRIPSEDRADYGWGPNNGRPVYFIDGKPQQRGKFMNATMGAASTAGKFASDFALGSIILKPFYPAFAEKIGKKAADAYQLGVDKPGACQTVSIVSPYIYEEDNWTDDMELGAMELFHQTGDSKYMQEALEYGRREPVTPWMGADSARHYQWYPFMNMGHYQLAHDGNTAVRKEFLRNLRAGLERVRERAAGDPFLYGVPNIWCSNNLTVALLTQCILYRELSGDNSYEEMESSLLGWLLGCNPWGTSMICQLPLNGRYPQYPHSCLTYEGHGTTTGGLVDGPVYSTIFKGLRGVNINGTHASNNYLDLQPSHIVFHDNMNDYSTNEPTMDGTASLTFPLSYYESQQTRHKTVVNGGVVRGDSTQKQIALVFTAAEWADGAETIIKALKENHVKGGFFFTGEFYEKHADIVKRLLAEGHYVGSHSYGHLLYASWENPDSMLVSQADFDADMQKSYRLMADFGIEQNKAPYFIPPYEYYNERVSSWARQLGLGIINFTPGPGTNADYTIPSMGKSYRTSKELYNRLMNFEKKNGLNGHFLMIHFGTHPERTDKFYKLLPQIIRTLRHRGYRFITVPEMMN